ncbi:hypothetical protein CAL20_02945 [Bordetella genomosp. 4]|uniref:Sialate O-acetylesterase domain-containing protein n=2 Tax=Bordetella genomosp. 4 TaxID=463044 RepID=A0A261USJ1_9BORD|nr:hypothetical protein CAL20_02945 [Bordetella genomosp. 4]
MGDGMTTYNTGNPVPSTDPRDLRDNAENYDTAMNDRDSPSWIDRLGRPRKTFAEIERLADPGTVLAAVETAEEAARTAVAANRTIFRATKAELLAAMQGPPAQLDETPGKVTNDPGHTVENPVNGDYVWRNGQLVYSAAQPATREEVDYALETYSALVGEPVEQYEFFNEYPVPEFFTDKAYVGTDSADFVIESKTTSGEFVFNGSASSGDETQYEFHNAPDTEGMGSVFVDRNEYIFANFSQVGDWSGEATPANSEANLKFPLNPLTQMLGQILYGQSLYMGCRGIPPLSTDQPYSNWTFGQGPRSTRPGGTGGGTGTQSAIPLIENTSNIAGNGSPDPGETPCSGAANFFSVQIKDWGIDPNALPVFSSTAGHGGYSITQLNENSSWIAVWRDHVTQQKARAEEMGKEYIVPVLHYGQGESDGGMDEIVWRNYFLALYAYQVSFVKSVTGQKWTPPMHTYQNWATGNASNPAKAYLWLARNYPNTFRLVTPLYHLPRADYASDGTHLSNIGSKHLGCYLGRASADVVLSRPMTNFIMPGKPVYESDTRIRIPHASGFPLQLTETTAQSGYKVLTGGEDAGVPVVTLDEYKNVILTLPQSVSPEDLVVRYARDYKPEGIVLNGGAGDLCDTDPSTVIISDELRSLRSYCPSFVETVTLSRV